MWSSKKSMFSKMALFIGASGEKSRDMDLECRSGQMGLNTRDTGDVIRLMGEASFGMPTEMSMMEIGKMTRHMEKESTFM